MLTISLAMGLLYIFSSGGVSASAVSSRQAGEGPAFDVAVAGAGPAGLTAALFAARAGLSVIVLGSTQGQLSETAALDNFPSFLGGGGGEGWLTATRQQAASVGVRFAQAGMLVQSIGRDGADFVVSTDNNDLSFSARSAIVATGSTARRLGLGQEDLLWGKQVHSCAICDGSTYHNKRVVVVGGGDAAVDAAILLARHAASVTIVHRRTDFRASNQRNVQMLEELSNVKLKVPFTAQQYIVKDGKLTGVLVEDVNDKKSTETIHCDGVFVMIGSTPNTAFLTDSRTAKIDLDSQGLVVLRHDDTASSVPGIFAAGEVTDNKYKQAITAASAGAQAAIDAERWLRASTTTTQRAIPGNIPLQIIETQLQQQPRKAEEAPGNTHGKAAVDDATCDLETPECITSIVNRFPVVVFSKPWCPYCKKALEALSLEGVTSEPYLHVVNLSMDRAQAKRIQAVVGGLSGGRVTVPNVFVGGKSIGGGDETVASRKSGRLRALLEEAKSYPVQS